VLLERASPPSRASSGPVKQPRPPRVQGCGRVAHPWILARPSCEPVTPGSPTWCWRAPPRYCTPLLLLALTTIEAATTVAFGLAGGFGWAVAAFLAYGGVRSLRGPLYAAWIVPMIQPPQVRATVLSTVGQVDAVGQVLGGPTIGLVATLTSPGLAIVAAGSALAPVAIVLGRLSTRISQPQDDGGQPASHRSGRSG
jgi:hypothetical protein